MHMSDICKSLEGSHPDRRILLPDVETTNLRCYTISDTVQASGFLKRALAQTSLLAWRQVRVFRSIFGHFRGRV